MARSFALCCWILLLALGSQRTSAQSALASLEHTAERYVHDQLLAGPVPGTSPYFIAAEPLDSRLEPQQCLAQVQPYTARATARNAIVTVGLYCADPVPWTAYVDVRVEIETTILVLRRPLARRSRVEPRDVELQRRRIPGTTSSLLTEVGSLSGHRLRRALPAGTALSADLLVPDTLLPKGQRVTQLADASRVGPTRHSVRKRVLKFSKSRPLQEPSDHGVLGRDDQDYRVPGP